VLRCRLIACLQAIALSTALIAPAAAQPDPASVSAIYVPGREEDARVAQIAFRLATFGRLQCPGQVPNPGLVLQHLSQFQAADRAGVVSALPLDRGPGVIAIVPDGPAAAAGLQPEDILLSVDGKDIPRESGLSEPFDAALARTRADAVSDLLAVPHAVSLGILREGKIVTLLLSPVSGCPSRVHLARSGQRNAYADGKHVFLTTAIVAMCRSDDELAFIIAHEMAHNILGHATLLRSDAVSKGIGRTLGKSGTIVRGTETQADVLATQLMLDAGFDAVGGAAVLKRLGGGDLGIALFAKHEPVGKRLAVILATTKARQSR
jgi:hypothetical protein